MSYSIYIIIILSLTLGLACESHNTIQDFPKDIQGEQDDKRIDIYINQLGNGDNKVRENAINSLINIANESDFSRKSVIDNFPK